MPKTLKRRPAVRKNPTFREATKMLYDLYDIDFWASEALDVKESYGRLESLDTEPRMPASGRFMFARVIPTLLILKLGAAVENMLDVLWARRFPEVKAKALRYEDKVRVIEKLHQVDLSVIRDLWSLRTSALIRCRTSLSGISSMSTTKLSRLSSSDSLRNLNARLLDDVDLDSINGSR